MAWTGRGSHTDPLYDACLKVDGRTYRERLAANTAAGIEAGKHQGSWD